MRGFWALLKLFAGKLEPLRANVGRTTLIRHIFFLLVTARVGKTSEQADVGTDGLLTQWIVKYGYLPIVLIGMAGLALDIGTREWTSDTAAVADAPVVAEPPVAAETFVERRPFTSETEVEPRPTIEPKPTIKTAALDPDVRL